MNFQLIPICSEIEHEMEYKYKEGHCDICSKRVVSYRCKNCDYSRCSGCHRDILASEEISERLRKAKIKNDIRLSELKLKEDGLSGWDVMVSDGEICYVNKLKSTYSFEYPYIAPPENSPNTKIEVRNIKSINQRSCKFTEIYDSIKNYFS